LKIFNIINLLAVKVSRRQSIDQWAEIMKPIRARIAPISSILIWMVAGVVLFASTGAAETTSFEALRPADTSSPRATLKSFVESMNAAYTDLREAIATYALSNRYYFDEAENRKLREVEQEFNRAIGSLDISEVSPILKENLPYERIIQLKEILDRIPIPKYEDVPDRQQLSNAFDKKWLLPNTEIEIVLMEDGPRRGEYLFSSKTVERLPEFFELVRVLPYRSGPGKQLLASYDALTTSPAKSIHQIVTNSPRGLTKIIPPRWMFNIPVFATRRIADTAVWQWGGLLLGITAAAMLFLLIWRTKTRPDKRSNNSENASWNHLLMPVTILILAGFGLPFVTKLLHISGDVLVALAFILTMTLFLSAAWASMSLGNILGQSIVASQRLQRRSLDSQLIRLGSRFIGFIVAVGLLVEGANQLGFPAYSVLAGLGVGGLAVALAARDTLANFLGSVVIMFEKPFRIGQWVKVGETDGIVEDVGFRSTRIRTFYNSLISIPNNEIVNATVDNLGRRTMRRQRFLLQITYNTPRDRLEQFIDRVKQHIFEQPTTDKNNIHVHFNKFGQSGLEILVYFFLLVPDYLTELQERERMLLRILDIAKDVGVEFAFPTRTIHVDNVPGGETIASKNDFIDKDSKPF
jgi:MscS family membrane protein